MRFDPHTAFPVRHNRPLCHLSEKAADQFYWRTLDIINTRINNAFQKRQPESICPGEHDAAFRRTAVGMHLPFSLGRAKGMQRIVALVSAAIWSSVSRSPGDLSH